MALRAIEKRLLRLKAFHGKGYNLVLSLKGVAREQVWAQDQLLACPSLKQPGITQRRCISMQGLLVYPTKHTNRRQTDTKTDITRE